jgi:GDPmannose 4,6-dehydratase
VIIFRQPINRIKGEKMGKTALITGVSGQDGVYLAKYLISLGYRVVGMIHSQYTEMQEQLRSILPQLELVRGDLENQESLMDVVEHIRPDEFYNIGAHTFVGDSFKSPKKYADVNGTGVSLALAAIKDKAPEAKFYQASSSEMFGEVKETPQNENTPFHPRNPYGTAKLAGHWYTTNYRESCALFACSGILFNHESPLRSKKFLTRKVTLAAARISLELQSEVHLGNIESYRDWGFAGDYVKAMHLMLQQEEPEDFVIATGETHSVKEFCQLAFRAAGIPITWDVEPLQGESDSRPKEIRQIGVNKSGQTVIRISEEFYRPTEVGLLVGDASKAKRKLSWEPNVTFDQLVAMMVESDLKTEKHKAHN